MANSEEGLKARLSAAKDQGVNILRALIGIDGFEVLRVAHHMILDLDAVGAVHVARLSSDIQSLAAVVAFDDRNHLWSYSAFVEQTSNPETGLQAECDLGLHVGELLLVKLHRGERLAELLSLEPVLPSAPPAILGGSHHPPGNAVARTV